MESLEKYKPESKLKKLGIGKDPTDPENKRKLELLHCVPVPFEDWQVTFDWCEEIAGDDWIWLTDSSFSLSRIKLYFVHSEHALLLKLTHKTA